MGIRHVQRTGEISTRIQNYCTGADTVFFMDKNTIKNIPKDRKVTYACIVTNYRPQKKDPNHVRITAGGNLTTYP
eukprot:8223616-Ditylum_brightwellii.AAC.1